MDQLSVWGSILLKSTAQEHDAVMGIVQTLRHFATFAFGQFLHRKRINLQRTLEFSSPIYRLELGMVGRLFAQDPSLYAEIIFASPDRRRLLKDYLASIQDNLHMIEKGEKEARGQARPPPSAMVDPRSGTDRIEETAEQAGRTPPQPAAGGLEM